MVTPNRLRSFSAEMLHALADNWDRLRDALDGDQARAQTKVVAPLTFDVWRGLGADRAMPVLNRITEQLGAARVEADAVATTLHDAARDLAFAQQKFLIAEGEAKALGFTVEEPDGRVKWSTDYAGLTVADAEARDKERAATAKPIADRIAQALAEATEADRRAAFALRQDVDFGPPDAFNVHAVGGGDAAEVVRVNDMLTRLDALNPAEFDALHVMLTNPDPVFAATLMKTIGPSGLLDFTGQAAQLSAKAGPGDPAQQARLQQLQKDLGTSLASASALLADDPAYMADLKRASDATIEVGKDRGYPGRMLVYGHQVLGVLLNNGVYDKAFLTEVGNNMLAFEQKAGKPSVWGTTLLPTPGFDLNVTGSAGAGFDPVTGLMNALSHNAAAATEFFHQRPDGVDPAEAAAADEARMKYLLRDREAIHDVRGPVSGNPPKASIDAVGHALEAATSGGAYGAPNAWRPPHSQAMAEVTQTMVAVLGEPIPPNVPAELRDSAGAILADYIDSVHNTLSANESPPANPKGLFLDDPAVQAVFKDNELIRTLSGIADDKQAIEHVAWAESVYAQLGLKQIEEGNASGIDAQIHVTGSAQVMGALDVAITTSMERQQIAADEQDNHASLWNGKWAYHTVGAVANFIPHAGDIAQRTVSQIVDYTVEQVARDTAAEAAYDIAESHVENREAWANQVSLWAAEHATPQEAATLGQATGTGFVTGQSQARDSLGRS